MNRCETSLSKGRALEGSPSNYRASKAWGKSDDEICVLCHRRGKHTGGPCMGVQPTRNQLDMLSFSSLKFDGEKIVHIYSIWHVLSMLIDLTIYRSSAAGRSLQVR